MGPLQEWRQKDKMPTQQTRAVDRTPARYHDPASEMSPQRAASKREFQNPFAGTGLRDTATRQPNEDAAGRQRAVDELCMKHRISRQLRQRREEEQQHQNYADEWQTEVKRRKEKLERAKEALQDAEERAQEAENCLYTCRGDIDKLEKYYTRSSTRVDAEGDGLVPPNASPISFRELQQRYGNV